MASKSFWFHCVTAVKTFDTVRVRAEIIYRVRPLNIAECKKFKRVR